MRLEPVCDGERVGVALVPDYLPDEVLVMWGTETETVALGDCHPIDTGGDHCSRCGPLRNLMDLAEFGSTH